ncbi:hypothetical protein RB653_001081 [Dictyostelium firmibasis]|uniref:Iron-containing redox enzyme family protein n=1 Tax=Dictyostelium firmibasis TaxID=79012 RepID=A0AAN7U6U4_9MYCE
MNRNIVYVKNNKKDEVYREIQKVVEEDRKNYNYSKDNIQTYAHAIQPHFTMWVNSLLILNIGREITEENCRDEMFGLQSEGNHSILCLDYFAQLGDYKLNHYSDGYKIAKKIYNHIKKPMVILTFLIANELAVNFLKDLENELSKYGVKDKTYIEIHEEADSIESENGHGIRLLNVLEKENSSVDDINLGIQLYREFYNDIFCK